MCVNLSGVKQCMSQLDQVGVGNSVSQVLSHFWHLFSSTQEQKLQRVFFVTPYCVGAAIAWWKFFIIRGIISNSLPQPDLGDHPGDLSKPSP